MRLKHYLADEEFAALDLIDPTVNWDEVDIYSLINFNDRRVLSYIIPALTEPSVICNFICYDKTLIEYVKQDQIDKFSSFNIFMVLNHYPDMKDLFDLSKLTLNDWALLRHTWEAVDYQLPDSVAKSGEFKRVCKNLS